MRVMPRPGARCAPLLPGAATLGVLLAPGVVAAHAGTPATPATLWSTWSAEPVLLVGLGLLLLLWARGVERTWREAGAGRVFDGARVRAAAAAFAAIAAALVTPIDAVAGALFSAHMVQHLLLIVVAAPLLVRADVPGAVFRALPLRSRRRLAGALRTSGIAGGWRALRRPLPAWVLHAGVLWLWHLPGPYEAALQSNAVHALEHATMLGTAVIFWLPVLSAASRTRMPGGAAILYLFTFGMQASLLGALLTLAERPWYDAHLPWTATWGLTLLEDQHIAGARRGGLPDRRRARLPGMDGRHGRTLARGRDGRGPMTPPLLALAFVQTGASVLAPAGPAAAQLARLSWYLIAMVSVVALFVFVLLLVGLRRRGSGSFEEPPQKELDERIVRRWVLLGGAVFPAVVLAVTLVLALLVLGATGGPAGGEPADIELVGRQWWWEVRYPALGITGANELHIPVGRPVRVRVRTADVIHSLWVPQLHGKLDMVPGKANEIVLEASRPGVYRGGCAEYCGRQHTNMELYVVAHDEVQFTHWSAAQRQYAAPPATPLQASGARVFESHGCGFCHTIRGTDARGSIGPDLTHVSSRRRIAGGILPSTQAAFGGWVANPHILKPGTRMPAFALPGPELRALSAYLESLR